MMKTRVVFMVILAGISLLAASQVFSHNFLEAPHNAAVMQTAPSGQCTTCHSIGGAFGGNGSFPDWATDAVCTSCHTDTLSSNPALAPYLIQAPAVQTHDGPKHLKPNVCIDCHTDGFQSQLDWVSSIPALATRVYLVQGTITSMSDNGDGTSTFGYSNAIINKDAGDPQAPDWSNRDLWGNKSGTKWGPNKDQTRGLIFVDLNSQEYTFEVKSATLAAITVKGSLTVQTQYNTANSLPPMKVGDPFALVYGQAIHGPATVTFPNQMMFFQNSGLYSFANNPPPTDINPCVVCHTQTNHWRNFTVDPNRTTADHNPNSKCTTCHPHDKGFSPSGACNTCHGYPPVVTTLGGPDGLANNPATTGATNPGAHQRHATNLAGGYNYPCDKCHTGGMPASPVTDYKIQIGFNMSPAYQSGTYYGRTLTNNFTYAPGNAGTTINPTPPAGVNPQSCTNIYCHSNAKIGTTAASYATPWWSDGPLACNSCHQYPPNYTNGGAGTPTANSHVKHVNNGFGCEKCHVKTVSGAGIIDITFHANTTINVDFDSRNPNGTYSASTKTCSNISCHNNTPIQWGAALAADCTSCHGGNATSAAPISTGSHTRHINNAAVLGTNYACGQCHAATVTAPNDRVITGSAHDNGVSDVVFLNGGSYNSLTKTCSSTNCHGTTSPTWGINTTVDVCTKCHGTPTASPAPDAAKAPPKDLNGDTLATDPQVGAHQGHLNGSSNISNPVVCTQCHQVPATVNAAGHIDTPLPAELTWGSLANKSGALNPSYAGGKCSNVYCHGNGLPNANGATMSPLWNDVNYLNGTASHDCTQCHGYPPGGTHPAATPTQCINCHNHVNATGTGFTDKSKHINGQIEGGDCIGCHSVSQGNRVATASQFSASSHHIQGVTLTNQHCYQCHWEANADGSINSTYHGGPSNPGAPVRLVIYGNGTRPTTYTEGTTAVSYTAGAAGSGGGSVVSPVKVVDTWRQLTTSGSGSSRTASFTAGAGIVGSRIMIIGMSWEDSNSNGCNPSSITGNYGGQTITTINEANSSNNRAGQWMGYIREAGIKARTNNTITLTFAGCTPDRTPTMSVATYESVDQTAAPSSAKASGTTGSSFSWSGLPVVNGGFAMYNIMADGISSFTPPSGYTERYDAATSNFRMSGGDKAVTANGTEGRTVTGNTSSSRWALVAVSINPLVTSTSASREIEKINQHCLGCHSAKNDAATPFGDGKTPKAYAWDNTSIDARYSQTVTTNWGKYSGNNTAPKVATKAYSAHGNAAANQQGWDSRAASAGGTGVDGTLPDTSGSVKISCFDCHNSHGSSVAGPTTSYDSKVTGATSGGILKDTTAGKGGYTVTYKPQYGGSVPQKNAYNPGAGICFDCHMTQTGGTTTPWGYNNTYGATQPIISYWEKPGWFGAAGTNPAGAQMRYPYKNAIGSAGSHFGASSGLTTQVMGTIGGLCTPCHDPHGVSPTLGTSQAYGVPLLKGTWMTSPYKEDAAPVATNEPRGGGREAAVMNVGSTPLYHIDQNTFDSTTDTRQASGTAPSWNFNSTKRVTETVDQFAGLCIQCHPKTSINPTSGGAWKSVDRIHNTVKGWAGTTGGNANNAVHSYTCSKCHTPHSSCLPRLAITNCLDFTHRGQVATGGLQPILNTESGRRGQGAGHFPGGGGGNGDQPKYPGPWFFGSTGGSGSDWQHGGGTPASYTRACHDNTNSAAYPANQRWNVKTPWGTPGPPQPSGGGNGGWNGGGWGR